jgi:hypothetical protein
VTRGDSREEEEEGEEEEEREQVRGVTADIDIEGRLAT